MELLKWLQDWYIQECINNKNCISDEIINIDTIDNPGWHIRINIKATKLARRILDEINFDNGDDDWVFIKLNTGVFEGVGDKSKLVFILQFFKAWCQNVSFDKNLLVDNYNNDLLYWLQNEWFCLLDFGGDFMYDYNVSILTYDFGWKVEIEVMNTYLENKKFNSVNFKNSINDWVKIEIKNGSYLATGDATKLLYIIEVFRKWARNKSNGDD